MAGLFGIDIGQAVDAYQSGGLFNAATNLVTQRYGGANNSAGPVPGPTQAAVANPPQQGAPPANYPAATGMASSGAVWWKRPITWLVGGGILVVGFFLTRRRK